MATKIFILSQRCGTCMAAPETYPTEKEANKRADSIMKEAICDAYETQTGKNGYRHSFKYLVNWADENGYGDSRFFWDGYNEATEVRITQAVV